MVKELIPGLLARATAVAVAALDRRRDLATRSLGVERRTWTVARDEGPADEFKMNKA